MVARILKLDAPPKPADAADAVALAICHLWRGAGADRIAQAAGEAGTGQQALDRAAAGPSQEAS